MGRGTVGFESGGMPKRMTGTKANDLASYKSRFETMGLASGNGALQASSMQERASGIAQRAQALGEAAGCGGARVPMVQDPAKTMERMLDKFVNKKLAPYEHVEALPKQAKDAKANKKRD